MTPPTSIIDNIVNKTMMDDTLRIVINFNHVNSNNKNINNKSITNNSITNNSITNNSNNSNNTNNGDNVPVFSQSITDSTPVIFTPPQNIFWSSETNTSNNSNESKTNDTIN